MRFITRARDPLWRVWITFGDFDSGQKYFSDRDYGGSEQALVAAKQLRDKTVQKEKIPLRVYDGNGFTIKHSKNKSGTVGINLAADRRLKPVRWTWEARVQVNGRQTTFGRSIRTHGYQKAWAMVAQVRAAHTGMKMPSKPPPPTQELLDWAMANGYDIFPKAKKKKSEWPFLD